MVASARSGNKTSEAIAQAYPRPAQLVIAEVPFSSVRKWSAVALDAPNMVGVWALGAVEFLEPYVDAIPDEWTVIRQTSAAWAEQGLRVLLFTHYPDAHQLHDAGDTSRLPSGMKPIGLIGLSDELRPEAQETLSAFREAGVQPKIISGDHPQTVAALARQVGLPHDIKLVSGPELATMNEVEFADAAESATIFGRITPQQKEQLVRALRQRGCDDWRRRQRRAVVETSTAGHRDAKRQPSHAQCCRHRANRRLVCCAGTGGA
jgi:cation-transporting ATPase E